MNGLGITKKILAVGFLAGCMMTLSTSLTGCLTDSKTTAVSDSTPMLAEQTLMVGAQGNTTYGSAVDLDAKKVLLSSAANAAQSSIDILFVYSGGNLQIMSPVAAKKAGDVNLAANYDTTQIKDTQFAAISTKPVSSQAADTIFSQTYKVDYDYAFEGENFLVKTGNGKLVFVNITSVNGNDSTASAEFTIAQSAL